MRRLLSTPEIRLVLAIHFFWHMSVSALWIVPKWLHGLSFTEGRIGVVMGIAGVTGLMATPLIGPLLDRVSRVGLLRTATFLSVPLILILPLAAEIGGLAIEGVRMVQGIAFGLAFPVAGALVSDFAPANERVRALGLFGVVTQLTQAAAPALAEWVSIRFGYGALFPLAAAGSGIGFCLTFALAASVRRRPAPTSATNDAKNVVVRPELRRPLSVLVAGTGITYGAIVTFVPVMLLNLGVAAVAPFFAAVSLASVAVRIFFGGLGDRMDQDRLILYSGFGATMAVVLAGVLAGVGPVSHVASWSGVILGLAFGSAAGLFYPVANVRYVDFGGHAERGRRMAYYAATYSAGITAGNLALGFLAEYFGFAFMYGFVAAVHGATVVMFFLAVRARR